MRDTLTMDAPVAPTNSMAKRATVASTVGSALEWIDFTAYGAVAATVFPKIFFSQMDPNMGILAAFATFGIGFFARPLGGLFFGALGDRIGRKNILLYTLSLMGAASFLIGCLPTYATIGFAAPLCLVLLRFLQGFALGGEATGAQLMTMEHAPQNKRGLYGSFINTGSSLSAALASGVLFALTSTLGAEQFQAWGWRIPFLMSFLLVVVGIYIRLRVSETPAFVQAHAKGAEERVHRKGLRSVSGDDFPSACSLVRSDSLLLRNYGLLAQLHHEEPGPSQPDRISLPDGREHLRDRHGDCRRRSERPNRPQADNADRIGVDARDRAVLFHAPRQRRTGMSSSLQWRRSLVRSRSSPACNPLSLRNRSPRMSDTRDPQLHIPAQICWWVGPRLLSAHGCFSTRAVRPGSSPRFARWSLAPRSSPSLQALKPDISISNANSRARREWSNKHAYGKQGLRDRRCRFAQRNWICDCRTFRGTWGKNRRCRRRHE